MSETKRTWLRDEATCMHCGERFRVSLDAIKEAIEVYSIMDKAEILSFDEALDQVERCLECAGTFTPDEKPWKQALIDDVDSASLEELESAEVILQRAQA